MALFRSFISIDCGITEGLRYTDNKTGLNYVSDAGFIDSGINQEILSKFDLYVGNDHWSLGNPFISALELRLLDNTMYANDLRSLILFKRDNFGASETVR
ncbi:hypothetical protein L1987_57208 [Smallanthus sonchifolius]|uniref:Uncharacterized protein n=1 Tax=Smallanthus sonchifolius TaxID=185202 RepID=A0ACB9DCU8_9ASTR|nr:hypothetical protein L1987_57208 [Smallanthus sonchifolius]